MRLSLFVFLLSIILALFKLLPVTLTAAGIAGFIISIGIAVDANVLIFERVKEELRSGEVLLMQFLLVFLELGFLFEIQIFQVLLRLLFFSGLVHL